MENGTAMGRALIAEAERRLLGESLPRLEKCLSLLSDEEIWSRPNAETVSVGNLILHLCGNVRQWILTGLGGAADSRTRSLEFSEKGPIPASELLQTLRTTLFQVRATLRALDPEDLLRVRSVQAFEESGVSILVHVIEHFSYHVGQVTYFVKSQRATDVGYYSGVDVDRTRSS